MGNDPVNLADYRRQRESGRLFPHPSTPRESVWDEPHPSALSDHDSGLPHASALSDHDSGIPHPSALSDRAPHLPHPSTLGDPGIVAGPTPVPSNLGRLRMLPDFNESADASDPLEAVAFAESATAYAWGRILASIPRSERLRYAGLLGEEGHLIDILAFDPDPAVRRCVALHPGLTLRGQWELARDPDSTIRERLASNECADPEILAVLGRDLDPVVRRSVAAHEATPEPIRRRLSRDKQPMVREALR